jgi:sulfite reductase (ferredoxin)
MDTSNPATPKRSSAEVLKEQSNYLIGDLPEQLANDSDHVTEDGYQLLKFSGMYQQDDRDQRKSRRTQGLDKAYSFMVRSKLPGGVLTSKQYLVHDKLATRLGNNTLRFTTRQGIQLHGILKGDIKPLLQELNDALVTTLAACGDVVRNVMACPAPEGDREHALMQQIAQQIEAHFLPRAESYYDLWLEGKQQVASGQKSLQQQVASGQKSLQQQVASDHQHGNDNGILRPVEDSNGILRPVEDSFVGKILQTFTPVVDEVEPIYGKTYLPRKFKIGIAFPHDNCVDVFTQDIGLVPVLKGETLQGFNIVVGGGMGMSHTLRETFPRLADKLGFVTPDELMKALEVIVSIQRDYGNRENRKRARMKYLIHDWGLEKFRTEFNIRFGREIDAWVDVGDFKLVDHLGWNAQGDGRYYYGIPIENGRIHDTDQAQIKRGLRAIAERFDTELRITAQHNILVCNLRESDQAELLSILKQHSMKTKDEISRARRYALACPSMPTCGLGLAEAERALPGIISSLERELKSLGLEHDDISIRMTGCPNGCARPFTAELAFVGKSLNQYSLYIGGSFEGLHLVEQYAELVHHKDLVSTVVPLFKLWKQERQSAEHFGDFCRRVGVASLKEKAAALQVS